MKNDNLAILGGRPVRVKEFRSRPYVTDDMINSVVQLMKEGRFSRFIGSPIPGSKDIIILKSRKTEDLDYEFSILGGPSVRKLESDWSKVHNVDYAISVNSATSGLTAAVLALGLEPGDEVICSPFSFTASATSIIAANAVPVFADIDLDTFCLDPNSAKESITERTKAIMPIHWNSNAGDLDHLLSLAVDKGLKIVEDASQSPGMLYQGKHLGTHGDIGIYSLNEPKNIMTGEGGIIVTNDRNLAVKCRLIRNHGESIVEENSSDKLLVNCIGYNFRLVELLAEIGNFQLKQLDYLNGIRKENFTYLIKNIENEFGDFIIPQKITHLDSYFPYTAGFRWLSEKSGFHRDTFAEVLRSEGIPVATGVSRLMSDNPMFKKQIAFGSQHFPFSYNRDKTEYSIGNLNKAKKLQNEQYLGFFQLGWPNTKEDMNDILSSIKKIMNNKSQIIERYTNPKNSNFISGR